MTVFTQSYVDLLIRQYWEKPNAVAEVELKASEWEAIRDHLASLPAAMDIDTATGNRLDIIGSIVGLQRRAEYSVDDDYRFLLRMKIVKNNASAYVVSDDKISIQSAIQFGFEGFAYVVNNLNMTMSIFILDTFDINRLNLLLSLDLLPRPQGVDFEITMISETTPFGYDESTGVFGYSELQLYTLTYDGVTPVTYDGVEPVEFSIPSLAEVSEAGGIYSEYIED